MFREKHSLKKTIPGHVVFPQSQNLDIMAKSIPPSFQHLPLPQRLSLSRGPIGNQKQQPPFHGLTGIGQPEQTPPTFKPDWVELNKPPPLSPQVVNKHEISIFLISHRVDRVWKSSLSLLSCTRTLTLCSGNITLPSVNQELQDSTQYGVTRNRASPRSTHVS